MTKQLISCEARVGLIAWCISLPLDGRQETHVLLLKEEADCTVEQTRKPRVIFLVKSDDIRHKENIYESNPLKIEVDVVTNTYIYTQCTYKSRLKKPGLKKKCSKCNGVWVGLI